MCNVHWQSDVDAGRLMASATVARLHADPAFLTDLAAAKGETQALQLADVAAGLCGREGGPCRLVAIRRFTGFVPMGRPAGHAMIARNAGQEMSMTSLWRAELVATALLMAALPVGANAQGAAPAAAVADKIDPVAIQALKGMGAYLKTLQSFEISSKATLVSTVEDSDIQISLGMENVYRVQRPDKFFITLQSDRQVRDYYYDGRPSR